MILPCTCYHEYQDKLYGTGNRVHNYARSVLNKGGGWRCTVCSKIKSGNISDKKESVKENKK